MLDWLVANVDLFGLPAQNWMLVIAGVVAAYAVVLLIGHRGQPLL